MPYKDIEIIELKNDIINDKKHKNHATIFNFRENFGLGVTHKSIYPRFYICQPGGWVLVEIHILFYLQALLFKHKENIMLILEEKCGTNKVLLNNIKTLIFSKVFLINL